MAKNSKPTLTLANNQNILSVKTIDTPLDTGWHDAEVVAVATESGKPVAGKPLVLEKEVTITYKVDGTILFDQLYTFDPEEFTPNIPLCQHAAKILRTTKTGAKNDADVVGSSLNLNDLVGKKCKVCISHNVNARGEYEEIIGVQTYNEKRTPNARIIAPQTIAPVEHYTSSS